MERLYIPELEEMVTGCTPLSDAVNRKIVEAYDKNTRAQNSRLDFDEIVFEKDVAEIAKFMRKHGQKEFTISAGFTQIANRLSQFENAGFTLQGIITVNTQYPELDGTLRTTQAFLLRDAQ